MKRTSPLLALLLLACGCASPHRSSAPLPFELPDRWTGASPEPVAGAWWESFQDPGLNQVVELALRKNHDLKAAAARLDAALAQARIAGAELYPSANLAFNSQRQQQNFVGLPIPGAGNRVLTSRSTTHGIAFNIRWELDLWGRLRAGRRAARSEAEASVQDLEHARLSLVGQTVKAWLAVAEARLQEALARRTVESYQATVRQVRERYEAGLRPPLDLRLALSNLAAAEALAAQRRREVEIVLRQLETLMGSYPSGRMQGAGSALPALPEKVPAGLPSELLARRPDLLAAERRLQAAGSRVSEARAAFFPSISLTGSGGRSSSELGDLLSNQFNVWSIAGNALQPVFEGGRLLGNLQWSKARVREAVENYAGSVLEAFREVETALVSETLLEAREAELRAASDQAGGAQALAEERYRSGLEDFITMLEAQRRSLETESQFLQVRRQRLENRVDLHLALGGGWSVEPSARAEKP